MSLAKYRDRQWLIQHTLFISLLSIGFIILGFVQLDQTIAFLFKQPEYQDVFYWSREITNAGYMIHYLLIASFVFIAARFFHHKIKKFRDNPHQRMAAQQWSIFVFKSLFISGIVIQILKIVFGRQRPHISESFENMSFDFINFHWHWHSFPSGHTQVMYTMATIGYLIWPKFRSFFFFFATSIAFTRVIITQHFFSDFVFGAFLGYIITLWVYQLWPPQHLKHAVF